MPAKQLTMRDGWAAELLGRAVSAGVEGPYVVMLTGAPGSGKTALLDATLAGLGRTVLRAGNPLATPLSLVRLMVQLGVGDDGSDDAEQLLCAVGEHALGDQPAVLAIDDAHTLDPAALSALARVPGLAGPGRAGVRLVLCGLPALKQLVGQAGLEPLHALDTTAEIELPPPAGSVPAPRMPAAAPVSGQPAMPAVPPPPPVLTAPVLTAPSLTTPAAMAGVPVGRTPEPAAPPILPPPVPPPPVPPPPAPLVAAAPALPPSEPLDATPRPAPASEHPAEGAPGLQARPRNLAPGAVVVGAIALLLAVIALWWSRGPAPSAPVTPPARIQAPPAPTPAIAPAADQAPIRQSPAAAAPAVTAPAAPPPAAAPPTPTPPTPTAPAAVPPSRPAAAPEPVPVPPRAETPARVPASPFVDPALPAPPPPPRAMSKTEDQLRREFDAFLARSGRDTAARTPAAREALFREYQEWRARNGAPP